MDNVYLSIATVHQCSIEHSRPPESSEDSISVQFHKQYSTPDKNYDVNPNAKRNTIREENSIMKQCRNKTKNYTREQIHRLLTVFLEI